jgi:hypothetical protein
MVSIPNSRFKQVEVNVQGLEPSTASRAIALAAYRERDRVIAESIARCGLKPTYRYLVDNRANVPFESVRPDGKILLAWHYLAEIAQDVMEHLVERSPHDTGTYIRGLILMINGVESDFSQIDENTTDLRIVASVNYARRLEVGHDGKGGYFSKLVEPHIVQETAALAAKRYANFVKITYNYSDLSDAHLLVNPAGWRKRGFAHDLKPIIEKHVRYPTIFLATYPE